MSYITIPYDLDMLISPYFSHEENTSLSRVPSSYDEKKDVIFSMHATKAPGPDGMSTLFYHTYWDAVGNDVASVQLFFKNGYMLRQLNSTHITVIPKSANAYKVSQFRPISLCNVLYEVI